ncbi:MAG: 50S ribosomal protein L11 [Planctomycetota bacterium]
MAKQIVAQVKVQITGGQATPAPPVGTALGPHGINLGKFVQEFNAKTKDITGTIVPVVVTVYNDRSFDFILKSPPAAVLIKKIAGIAKGSARPNAEKVGVVTKQQITSIAKDKMVDLNTSDMHSACRMVEGTARSMGVLVTD